MFREWLGKKIKKWSWKEYKKFNRVGYLKSIRGIEWNEAEKD